MILRKIFKLVATKCEILRLKCTKFNFGCGSAPDPAGKLTTLPDLLAGFKGPTFKGGKGKGVEWEGKRGMEREQEGREKEGTSKVGSHSDVRKPEKIPIVELI